MPVKKYVYITEDTVQFHHGKSLDTYDKDNLGDLLAWAKGRLEDTINKNSEQKIEDLDKQEEVVETEKQLELPNTQ